MIEYDKLVRDKIPEVIEASGKKCDIEILSDEQYLEYLNKKIKEEVNEYLEEGNRTEELVDIATVIMAILEYKGISFYDFVRMYSKKLEIRGGFKDKIFLVKEK